jgi:hypothetical protein
MTIKIKNNEIPYFLNNGNLGSIKDLLLLSLKEQEEQINKFIDDYKWIAKKFMNIGKLSDPSKNNFILLHKKVLKIYVSNIFSSKKKINIIDILEDLSENSFYIYLSFNFDKNDFSKSDSFFDKITQLEKNQLIFEKYPDKKNLDAFGILKFHLENSYYYPYNHPIANSQFSIQLEPLLMTIYFNDYLDDHLKTIFSFDYYDNYIQNLLSTNIYSYYSGITTKIVSKFMQSFYEYIKKQNSITVSSNMLQICKFIFSIDHQSFVNRPAFKDFIIRFAKENTLEQSIQLLKDLSEILTPAKFFKIKTIINENCEAYKLSNLYSFDQKPAYIYDIIFPTNNINIIFNECNICDFINNYLFIEEINTEETKLTRIRLILDKETTLPSNEVINILQSVFSKAKKSFRKNLKKEQVDMAVHSALRLISINNVIYNSNPMEKQEYKKKKI